MTDTTLTDTERAALAAYLRGQGITDEPDKYDDGIHSWRCAFPATYGRCGCFAEAITDLSAAVESIVAARVADRDTWWRERVAHLAELGSREAWSPDDWTDAAHDILRAALAAEARTQGGAS